LKTFLIRLLPRVRKTTRILRNERWRAALLRGVPVSFEQEWAPLPDSVGTVLDVGANRGQFALWARERFPTAALHSFEPLAEARSKLTQLLAQDPQVTIYGAAVGSTSGRVKMNVAATDHSSSVLEITTRQAQTFPGTHKVTEEEVDVVRLDDVFSPGALRPPVLLKIDVQGYELEVLRGAERLLAEVDFALIEASFAEFYRNQPLFDDIVSHLRARGFGLVGGSVTQIGNRWQQGDFLWVRHGVEA
jgi:FkbM family methyltransferase